MNDSECKTMREGILSGQMSRYDVEVDEGTPMPKAEGYFGNFTIIAVGGKKTLVFCDPRDSRVVPMLGDFYDDIAFTETGWDVDTRFQTNPNSNPLLVKRDGKWTMIGYYGNTDSRGRRVPYCDDWYDSISTRDKRRCIDKDGNVTSDWMECSVVERWYDAVKDGMPVRLTNECQVLDDGNNKIMAEVRQWDKDKIKKDWIGKGRPCYAIYGFRFKGAKAYPIDQETASELIDIHSFGKGYHSLSWNIEDGKLALVFESYSEGDME